MPRRGVQIVLRWGSKDESPGEILLIVSCTRRVRRRCWTVQELYLNWNKRLDMLAQLGNCNPISNGQSTFNGVQQNRHWCNNQAKHLTTARYNLEPFTNFRALPSRQPLEKLENFQSRDCSYTGNLWPAQFSQGPNFFEPGPHRRG